MAALRRLACVDDDPHILMILEAMLRDGAGYEVTTYNSGPAALQGLAKERPQLLLLDVCMPNMDGMETAQRLRAAPYAQGLPIAFLTARTEPRDLELYRRAGVRGLIPKPFDPALLLTQVEAVWRQCSQVAPA